MDKSTTLASKMDTGLDVSWSLATWVWLHEVAMMLPLLYSGPDSFDTTCLGVQALLVFTGPCDSLCPLFRPPVNTSSHP